MLPFDPSTKYFNFIAQDVREVHLEQADMFVNYMQIMACVREKEVKLNRYIKIKIDRWRKRSRKRYIDR